METTKDNKKEQKNDTYISLVNSNIGSVKVGEYAEPRYKFRVNSPIRLPKKEAEEFKKLKYIK